MRKLALLCNCTTRWLLTSGSSSHARLENKLNLLIDEIRAGKREGSVISTKTFDSAARNDQETWEALRRELEDIGISPSIIVEKRQFIIAWFREAIVAKKFEEDTSSDDPNSATFVSESDSVAVKTVDHGLANRNISSTTIKPLTTERSAVIGSVPNPQQLSKEEAQILHWRLPVKGVKSPSLITYLLNKVRRRDMQFLEAAMAGDVVMIDKLLEKKVDIHVRGTQNLETDTALHLATRYRRKEAARFLLSNGADIEARNGKRKTALHLAADNGDEQITLLLLEMGAYLESKTATGYTALTSAANAGDIATVRLLIEKGAEIETRALDGVTALVSAANAGHADMVRLLLRNGADPESKPSNGHTALITAASAGHVAVVRLLLERGVNLESKNSHGHTALNFAAEAGHTTVVRLLLDQDADVKSKDPSGNSALAYAAKKGHTAVVQLLLEKGADVNSSNTYSSETALMYAASKGRMAVVCLLLQNGAEVNLKNSDDDTALSLAALHREDAVVRLLLEKEAQVDNRRDRKG